MKKLSTLFFTLVLACSVSFAQTPLTVAQDFTVTTIHGEQFNLFDKLDEGKHVIIDFFFTTCGPCIASVPDVNQSYEKYGCNNGEVYFISMDSGDTDAEVLQYEQDYGGLLPSVSGVEGGGNAVNSTYGISAYPTIILIAPNRDIIVQDIWPATQANFDNAINGVAGIAENSAACSTVGVQDLIENSTTQIKATFPNPATSNANLSVTLAESAEVSVKITDLLGQEVAFIAPQPYTAGEYTIDLPIAGLANGTYVVNLYADNQIADVSKLAVVK